MSRLRELAARHEDLSEQHFQLGGTHADKGSQHCDCELAKQAQAASAEWQAEYDLQRDPHQSTWKMRAEKAESELAALHTEYLGLRDALEKANSDLQRTCELAEAALREGKKES